MDLGGFPGNPHVLEEIGEAAARLPRYCLRERSWRLSASAQPLRGPSMRQSIRSALGSRAFEAKFLWEPRGFYDSVRGGGYDDVAGPRLAAGVAPFLAGVYLSKSFYVSCLSLVSTSAEGAGLCHGPLPEDGDDQRPGTAGPGPGRGRGGQASKGEKRRREKEERKARKSCASLAWGGVLSSFPLGKVRKRLLLQLVLRCLCVCVRIW